MDKSAISFIEPDLGALKNLDTPFQLVTCVFF